MKNIPWTAVDIETSPDIDRAALMFEPLPDFDPKAVKYGNTKDPGKRAMLLEEKRDGHHEEARAHAENFVKKAALSPATGRIISIGWRHAGEDAGDIITAYSAEDEADLISEFVARVSDKNFAFQLVNWSGTNGKKNFDANFVYRRAMALNQKPQFFRKCFHDAASEFMQFEEYNGFLKLTAAAKELGIEVPNCAPVAGENYHRFITGTATAEEAMGLDEKQQEAAAEKYLTADVDLLWEIVTRMGMFATN